MPRVMQRTPERMVENGRVAAFGHFDQPFRTNNILDADVFGLGRFGAKLLNRYRLKDWQHVAVFSPDFLLTFVVLNAHYLASSFCYFVDRQSGRMIEYHREAPPWTAKLARELWNDRCTFAQSGYAIGIHNHLDQNRHHATLDIQGKADQPGIHADLTLHADLERHQPLEVVLRLAPNRPAYSHKMACPVSGTLHVGRLDIPLDPSRCLALVDVHKAYYPYRMTWRWASCAGFDAEGRVVGLNLTHNVVRDDTENNENGLWVGKNLSMFKAARFAFDEGNPLTPWHIGTEDGRCRLEFHPDGERRGVINAGILTSDYHQPYGSFSGTAVDDEGKTHPIKNFFGVTEFHQAKF